MKTHFSFLACILIFCGIGGGCIVLDGKSKEWEEMNTPIDSWENSGPGNEDGELRQQVKQQWEIDTHENIAIGLFPGFACDGCYEYFRKKKEKGRYKISHRIGHWCEVAACIPSNVLWGIPTIWAALIEPFGPKGGQLSEYAIVGCHRWLDTGYEGNVNPNRYQGKSEILEKQLLMRRSNQSAQTASITLPIPELGPTTVYMEYPGFWTVRQCVAKEKRAAVVFSTSSQASTKSNAAIKLRCFRPSAYDKQALAYEDINVDGGGVLAGYVRKYRKVKEAGEKAVQLKGKDQQIDEVLQPLEKELALQTALQLSDARLSQVESVLEQCGKYLDHVAPVKKRVDDLILKAPEDKRLRQLSNQLEYKTYSSLVAADGVDISKLQDEVSVAERHSAKIGKLTTKAAGLADLVPYDNNIVLLAAQCKALMPCSVSDSELEDLQKQIESLDGKWSKISRLLDRALSLQNKIPENETLKNIVEELKTARPTAANDERLAAISNDINSITKRVNAIAPLAKKANSILKELPKNEELKKVCGQLDLRGKSLPDDGAISELEHTLLQIESKNAFLILERMDVRDPNYKHMMDVAGDEVVAIIKGKRDDGARDGLQSVRKDIILHGLIKSKEDLWSNAIQARGALTELLSKDGQTIPVVEFCRLSKNAKSETIREAAKQAITQSVSVNGAIDNSDILKAFKLEQDPRMRELFAKYLDVKDISREIIENENDNRVFTILMEEIARAKRDRTFVLGGFYLGMRIKDALALLRAYLPGDEFYSSEKLSLFGSSPQTEVEMQGSKMLICKAKEDGTVIEFRLPAKLLKRILNYDVNSYYAWATRFGQENGFVMRNQIVNEALEYTAAKVKLNGLGMIDAFPTHLTLFGDRPQEPILIRGVKIATQESYVYVDHTRGYEIRYFGACKNKDELRQEYTDGSKLVLVRASLWNQWIAGSGAEEGTLQVRQNNFLNNN